MWFLEKGIIFGFNLGFVNFTMDILFEDQSHSFLYLTFKRTSPSLCYKKALHKSKRKFIYILALIQHCLKIHLGHLIFDCDRLMGILGAYLVLPDSTTEWSKMIAKQSVCCTLSSLSFIEMNPLKFESMFHPFPLQKVILERLIV